MHTAENDVDVCPMHSPDPVHAAVRNNRQILGYPPQPCTCQPAPIGNYLAPDGYRYGVMFNDGFVADRWNGRTQRERAARAAAEWAERYAPDNITLARRLPGEPWTRVIPPAMGDAPNTPDE